MSERQDGAAFDMYIKGDMMYVTIYTYGSDAYTLRMDTASAKEFFSGGLRMVEEDFDKRVELIRHRDVLEGLDAEAAALYYRTKWEDSRKTDD